MDEVKDPRHPVFSYIPINIYCTQTGDSRAEAYRKLARGQLQAVKNGRKTMISVDSIARYLESLPRATFKPLKDQGRLAA